MGTCRAIEIRECQEGIAENDAPGVLCVAHRPPAIPGHPLRTLRTAYDLNVARGGAHAQAISYLARAVNARLVAKQINAEADDLYRAAVKRRILCFDNFGELDHDPFAGIDESVMKIARGDVQ